MTPLEEELGSIFDQALGCRRAPSQRANLWCYWPNSTEPPCEACRWLMEQIRTAKIEAGDAK